jgi:hypothetical protein
VEKNLMQEKLASLAGKKVLGPLIQKSTRTYVIIFFGGSNKIPIV